MFYRFDVFKGDTLLGGLFRSTNLILAKLEELSSTDYWDYDRCVGKLEYLLDVPPRKLLTKDNISVYTQFGVDEVRETLEIIEEILESHGYRLQETFIEKPKEVVWFDNKQALLVV